jgi:hypothetical protein
MSAADRVLQIARRFFQGSGPSKDYTLISVMIEADYINRINAIAEHHDIPGDCLISVAVRSYLEKQEKYLLSIPRKTF